MKRRIFIDHGEAYGNLGDEAMLLNALRRLEARLGPVTFVLPHEGARPLPALGVFDIETTPSPFNAFIRLGERIKHKGWHGKLVDHFDGDWLAAWAWASEMYARSGRLAAIDDEFRRFAKSLRGCAAFYGVGAADFNDINAQGVAYKSFLYRFAKTHVPVLAVSAQGFGPLDVTRWRKILRRGLGAVDFLAFRDHAFSADLCTGLGLAHTKMKIVGDEAFTLPNAPATEADAALAEAGLAPETPFVAVHWRHTDYTQTTEKFLPRVVAAFDIAAENGLQLVFIPMSYDEHSGDDAALVGALRGLMRHPQALLGLPVQRDVRVNRAVIGRARFTLGLSYHVHVFALSQGKPAVILYTGAYYRYKSEGLADFYGSPTVAIDLATASDGVLTSAIGAAYLEGKAAEGSIARVNAGILAANDWTMDALAGRMRQG